MHSIKAATCPEPDKVRFDRLSHARALAKDKPERRLRPYPCGDHYHLTSRA
jgi:hypothetical protein